jgi:enamine deaminase RidA (YjgF/YER057c/UK114 family)
MRVPGPAGFSLSDAVAIDVPGTWIHVSGQVARDADREDLQGDLAAQAHACFDQIAAALERCGASLEHVVRISAYVTTFENYAAYNGVRATRFAGAPPASTTVQVAGLLGDGALIEIDAVAFVPSERS